MHHISVGACIRQGWETFKKRPLFLISVVLVVILVSSILGALAPESPKDLGGIILSIAIAAINILIEMGLIAFALRAHDRVETARLKDLWHPGSFWKYVAVKILSGIIVVIGLILLVVPGIIAALAFIFATYLVIERNMGPIAAMKESVRMTKGHRWQLFLLALALIALNILGALAILIGLLVTVPVSLIAVVHAYRQLGAKAA